MKKANGDIIMSNYRFRLGEIILTIGIVKLIKSSIKISKKIDDALFRYAEHDWGDTCEEDKFLNDLAVKNGNDRVVALYKLENDIEIFIITEIERDRSYTTIMLTEEY